MIVQNSLTIWLLKWNTSVILFTSNGNSESR